MEIKVNRVWIDDVAVYIELSDGSVFSEQFENYPRLKYATSAQRADFEYNDVFIHWEALNEDLSIEGFMHKKPFETNDLGRFFKQHTELNVSAVARTLGIPQSLMASYLCGVKKPSPAREIEIKNAIRNIGKELMSIA